MSQASDIKDKIKAHLDALVTAQTLGEAQIDDLKVSTVFDRDIAAYPCAILTPPAIEGGYLTNRENVRTHTYAIVVIQKVENIATANDIENLMDAILTRFDNDPTLGGAADAGMEPASTSPEPILIRGQSYVYFTILIKAKAIKNLTF